MPISKSRFLLPFLIMGKASHFRNQGIAIPMTLDRFSKKRPKKLFDPSLEKNAQKFQKRVDKIKKLGLKWSGDKVESSTGDSDMVQEVTRVGDGFCEVDSLLRGKLSHAWQSLHKEKDEVTVPDGPLRFSPLQQELAEPMFSLRDTIHTATHWEKQQEYQELYCLHTLNEVLKVRQRVLKNNAKLAENPELELRDQGFTRPRILILVPFKSNALSIVEKLSKLWKATGGQTDNQKRLYDQFGPTEEDLEREQRRRATNQSAEFQQTFKGNNDDCFRLGIKMTRKSMKLFCDFYSADIIIASPLGMRFVIDGQSERIKIKTEKGKRIKKRISKKGDFDFLSSIQTVIIDQADVISMQNWDHLLHTMDHLNKIPKDSHGCDFARVQSTFLDGNAANTRQNILFSSINFPELNALCRKEFKNCHGAWKCSKETHKGLLSKIAPLKSAFHPIPFEGKLADLPKIRLEYFMKNIISRYEGSGKAGKQDHICIFISSYLDFVQVRARFQEMELSHAILSEYCTQEEISAARTRFFSGHVRYLLVSERFYFFKRYHIRAVQKLIFYSVPEYAEYFVDWCQFVDRSKAASNTDCAEVPILFALPDYLKLERIVGSKRISQLINP